MLRTIRLGVLTAIVVAASWSCGWFGPSSDSPGTRGGTPGAASSADFRNGLDDSDRATFYRLSEGSVMFPLAWFESMGGEPAQGEAPTETRFRDNLERFGFIPDPTGPSGLPVGMTVDKWEGQEMIGINCAACHVGQITYKGHTLRIDGAPNMIRPAIDFVEALGDAVGATLSNGQRRRQAEFDLIAWHRSRDNLLLNAQEILGRIQFIRTFLKDQEPFTKIKASQTTKAGFGRVDAFGLGRNLLFAGVPGGNNIRNADAPVSIPHLWGIRETAWLQWGANTNSVLERNIGQALITGARFLDGSMTRTTVPIRNLRTLEQIATKITAPKWPEDVFGAVDQEKAERGRVLYEGTCATCHQSPLQTTSTGLKVRKLFSLEAIRTDPATAINFDKTVRLGPNGPERPFPSAAADVIRNVKNAYYREQQISATLQNEWEDRTLRPSPDFDPMIRTTLAAKGRFDDTREGGVYPAKPLAGIWATAPYLHNGSVPTLYHLLLPPSQRPATFMVGQREYDPLKLGYELDLSNIPNALRVLRPFEVDVRQPGNSNSGHEGPEFGTTLNETQRFELLEYLKILPPE